MGGVIDTSVFAACERKGWTAQATITRIFELVGEPLLLSSIVAAELAEGVYRAKTVEEGQVRLAFVHDIFTALPPTAFTAETAWIAGRMRGEQARAGNTLPSADSLIAAVALQADLAVVTLNVRDFAKIPGLRVIPFVLS